MSIMAYVGLPRSGKSYGAVEHQIIPALKAGRKVVTNLPMYPDKVADMGWPGELVIVATEVLAANPDKLYDYVTAGCVFLVDELWKILPQGMTALNCPETWKRLFAEHGHMVDAQNNGTQVVLIVQDLANIAPFARRLVENTFVSHKLGFVGLNKSYRVDIYYGAVTGCTPNVNKRLRYVAGSYKKEVYNLYKSQTMSEASGGHGDESKIDGRANILMRPAFIIGAIACPILIWYSLHTFAGAFHGAGHVLVPPAQTPGSAIARSGAERDASAGGFGRRVSEVAPDIRVLLEVVDRKHPEKSVVYLADGPRIVQFAESECRRFAHSVQCLYRGAYYDAAGYVEGEARQPLVVNAGPVPLRHENSVAVQSPPRQTGLSASARSIGSAAVVKSIP